MLSLPLDMEFTDDIIRNHLGLKDLVINTINLPKNSQNTPVKTDFKLIKYDYEPPKLSPI